MTEILKHLIEENTKRWKAMHVKAELSYTFDGVAERLCRGYAVSRYENVSKQTSVPWWVIAVIHEREASQSWQANLAQGDPWNERSIHDPRGQGPFKSWEDAAVFALERSRPYASHWSDWTPGGTATLLEQYNGLGYANQGVPSPYCWAGSDQYHRGKYIADHHFDPNAIDHQLGCMPLISRMMLVDRSIAFK